MPLLLIDVTLREAEFAKFYQDTEVAMTNFRRVIELCETDYP